MTLRGMWALAVALLAASALQAQNADVQAERVTLDAALLRAVRGTASVGQYAVWPGPLSRALDTSRNDTYAAFDAWSRDYYGWGDRFHVWTYGDSSLRLVADASMMVRAGFTDDASTSEAFVLGRPSVQIGRAHV